METTLERYKEVRRRLINKKYVSHQDKRLLKKQAKELKKQFFKDIEEEIKNDSRAIHRAER